MKNVSLSDVLQLSVPERIQLAEDIWDSIVSFPEAVPLTDAQKAELDHRLEKYRQSPEQSIPWSTVKEKIQSYNK